MSTSVMVRVDVRVFRELERLRASLRLAARRGQVALPPDERRVTYSVLVKRLVRHVQNDRRRMREAAARRRERDRLARETGESFYALEVAWPSPARPGEGGGQ